MDTAFVLITKTLYIIPQRHISWMHTAILNSDESVRNDQDDALVLV